MTSRLVAPEDLDMSTKQIVTVYGAGPSSSDPKQVGWEIEVQPSHTGVQKNSARLILSVVQNGDILERRARTCQIRGRLPCEGGSERRQPDQNPMRNAGLDCRGGERLSYIGE